MWYIDKSSLAQCVLGTTVQKLLDPNWFFSQKIFRNFILALKIPKEKYAIITS